MSPTEEFYPMPAFPIPEVRNLVQSAQWYQDALGFSNVFTMPGPGDQPSLIHLRWAKYADLLLRPEVHQTSGETKGRGVTLAFRVVSGIVDEMADRARHHGAEIVAGPEDKPWNARELTVADPDGFRLTFTKGPLEERDMADVIATVQRGQVENET